ncbi:MULTISPECIES: barstar family protein [unclassified Nocardioides]|uniref:barstar family protein n=1 Tax=unclassified Nocardioides TaxID=2615069 RepID=UPI0009EB2C6B|nr:MULTISPECIES: barstar family protein [unclassified Nocardioides]
MSGLAGILAGHHATGVFTWHAGFEVDDVRHAVEHAGWQFGHVDGWVATTKAEVLIALGESLAFPDYYGRNFDALADCLADLDRDVVLLWDGWSTLARADSTAFDITLDVLTERAQAPGKFVVLLRGDGPELPADIASLD